ncbi:hypothetical protein HDU83_009668 [Entophlyctis luteolus]|nr:hypothetical protein HDU83_009668 [Entophlyctis luteolus]
MSPPRLGFQNPTRVYHANSNQTADNSIDWDLTYFVDYLNGEYGRLNSSDLFGGSLTKSFGIFDVRATWKRIYEHARHLRPADFILPLKYQSDGCWIDFVKLTRTIRAASILHTIIHDRPDLHQFLFDPTMIPTKNRLKSSFEIQIASQEAANLIKRLDKHIFPWIWPQYETVHEMQGKFQQSPELSGIVISFGDSEARNGFLSITALRHVLNCSLPIELMYAGNDDLSKEYRDAVVREFRDVRLVNLQEIFPMELSRFYGWSIKPYAILASSFSRVLFVDADVLFFKDPAKVIFERSKLFKQYGVLFYHDRSIEGGLAARHTRDWILAALAPPSSGEEFSAGTPPPSRTFQSLRIAKGRTRHELESGVIAFDKTRSGVLRSLLVACLLNSSALRKGVYARVWGDKETFWMAMELVRAPYAFSPTFAGALGYQSERVGMFGSAGHSGLHGGTRICGSMFHVDEELDPFWWNGGVLLVKRASATLRMRYEQYAVDSEWGSDAWDWESEARMQPFCFWPSHAGTEVRMLEQPLREVTPATPTAAVSAQTATPAGGDSVTEVQLSEWARMISMGSPGIPTVGLEKSKVGYLVGRHKECDIIVDRAQLSKRHCLVFQEVLVTADGNIATAFIEDLSSNGTWVNRKRLEKGKRHKLCDGDEILLLNPKDASFEPFWIFKLPSARAANSFAEDYVIESHLGSGNFASVELAVHKATGSKHAVKIIDKKLFAGNEKMIQNIQQEIEILMTVNHVRAFEIDNHLPLDQPCIINIGSVYDLPHSINIVMEQAKGGELFDRIIERVKFTEHESRILMTQLLGALDYLHKRSIVHRDLKPENILLVSQDKNDLRIKISDFGLAKLLPSHDFLKTLCGTPNYVAPEVLKPAAGRGTKSADSRAYGSAVDLWSCGVIMYICLVGQPPFSDELAPPTIDLIKKLIIVDPDARLTASQALAHDWFHKDATAAKAVQDDPAIMQLPVTDEKYGFVKYDTKFVDASKVRSAVASLGSNGRGKRVDGGGGVGSATATPPSKSRGAAKDQDKQGEGSSAATPKKKRVAKSLDVTPVKVSNGDLTPDGKKRKVDAGDSDDGF